jgi:RNA polymerase sigma-70 factor (ECF subfamily)
MYADDASRLPLSYSYEPEDTPDGSTLAERLATDPEAFSDLYRLYLERVYRYLRARSSTEEEAADLTQQVFLKALDAIPRYRNRGVPVAAWLFRIARNVATDAHRRRKPTVDWDHLPHALQAEQEQSLEVEVVRRESLAQLRSLLSQLDPGKRELLALRFVAELSVREIAEVVRKRPAAVHKQLTRTLQTLKEQYHD